MIFENLRLQPPGSKAPFVRFGVYMNIQNTFSDPISLADVNAARDRISSLIIRTPLVPSPSATDRAGMAVHLKLECFSEQVPSKREER